MEDVDFFSAEMTSEILYLNSLTMEAKTKVFNISIGPNLYRNIQKKKQQEKNKYMEI